MGNSDFPLWYSNKVHSFIMRILAIMLALFAYIVFPHVRYRINIFTDDSEINYQVQKSLDAISSGGIVGARNIRG